MLFVFLVELPKCFIIPDMKDKLSQTNNEIRLAEWCKEKGIKRFLFDLDDTLCPTGSVFREVMSQAFDFLATSAQVNTRDEWKEEVETVNNRLFEQYGVNRNRWDHVMDELAGRYDLNWEVTLEAKRIFQLIYTTPLSLSEGSDEGLSVVKKTGVPIGIVTHAGIEWTQKKYEWLGLNRFLEWRDIFVVDENGHKTSESWRQAVNYFRVKPAECLVVGDSPRSDINPAREAGVTHCLLLEDPLQWSVHNQPVDPSVRIISRLDQIAQVILEVS